MPSVTRTAGFIGAEVHGVDLASQPSQATVSLIRHSLLEYKVLFFRGQRLNHETHIRFARLFGATTQAHPHEEEPLEGFPEIRTIDPERDAEKYGAEFQRVLRKRQSSVLTGWHTDLTALVNPPMGSILRAEVVPAYGGDTQWTNLEAAYEDLSRPLQVLADSLRAVHRFRSLPAAVGTPITQGKNAQPYVAEHPVVRVHPETGRKLINQNPSFTSHIVGVSTIESRILLDLFFSHITRPEFTCRLSWNAGDVAFWDNRATAHLAPTDLTPEAGQRRMYRVTIMGDLPIGSDGQPSKLLAGTPLTPSVL